MVASSSDTLETAILRLSQYKNKAFTDITATAEKRTLTKKSQEIACKLE